MANSILTSHYSGTSNTILVSHSWPPGTSNSVLASHAGDYPGGGGGGDLTHGAEFTITGTFPSRAAKPLVYDNFESGTVGNPINGQAPLYREIGASWTWITMSNGGSHQPRYSSTVVRPNSTRSSYHEYPLNGTYTNALEIDYLRDQTGDEVFFSFWVRKDKVSALNTRNYKPWDVFGTRDGVAPAAYMGYGPDLRSAIQDTGLSDTTIWASHLTLDAINAEWIRVEGYLKQSSTSAADGVYKMWVHRSGTPGIELALDGPTKQMRTGAYGWLQWIFGAYHATDTDNAVADVYVDQLYFDNTRARVELGNASTWAACTRREVQPSTAWSTGSITALCQKGALSTGGAWLYVVGTDGVPSAGIPVTLN